MRYYASRTGTKRNLAGMRAHGWGILVSRAGVWRTEGFDDWVGENGAWSDSEAGRPFQEEEFERFLLWVAVQPVPPQWLAIPDIVYGGLASLVLSRKWYRRLRRRKAFRKMPLMLVVQDGMEPKHVRRLIGPNCGIFIGGSTEWKLATCKMWADFAHSRGAVCHMGRVNTQRRLRKCEDANIDSADGSNGSRFAKNIRKLDNARRQQSFEGYLARLAA